jgi:acyl-CoA synthetase (NDP forming)
MERVTVKQILEARSLALVGASNRPFKFGSLFLASLLAMGFDGRIYPVHEREKEIMGVPAYPDLPSLPEAPELVYFTVPAFRCMEAMRQCVGLGVKAVVIMAAGFREAGPGGEELEREALRLAREGGFRIIGPNCFGIYNPRTRLTLLPGHDFSPIPGKLGFFSQSGGFAAHFGRMCMGLGMGFSSIISYGNGADVCEAELLEHFLEDGDTAIVAGYLEGAREGRAFFEALRRSERSKPVILWKVGRGEAARRAVASHTGSLAGSSRLWDELFIQCGVIPVQGLEEMSAVAQCFYRLEGRPARRVLMMGGGGGLGAHGADLAESHGLELPSLAPHTEKALREALPAVGAVVANPLDIGTPLTLPAVFERVAEAVAGDPATDIVLFDLAVNFGANLLGAEGVRGALETLREACRERGKPCAFNLYNRAPDDPGAAGLHLELRRDLAAGGALVFDDLRSAFRSLGAYSPPPIGG